MFLNSILRSNSEIKIRLQLKNDQVYYEHINSFQRNVHVNFLQICAHFIMSKFQKNFHSNIDTKYH